MYAIRFDLLKGERTPPNEVPDVMRDHKHDKVGNPNGLSPDAREDPESFSIGLNFRDLGPRAGKAWVIEKSQFARDVIASIGEKFGEVARKMETGVGSPG